MLKTLTILGSTGSIGVNTLKVIEMFPGKFRVVGLTAKANIALLEEQIKKFSPQEVAVMEEKAAQELERRVGQKVKVWRGLGGLIRIATHPEVDTVVSALMGSVGLMPILAAIKSKKNIALANKETLVMAGATVIQQMREMGVQIIPIDSEHSAIFQCLHGERIETVRRLVITGSGGPFYDQKVDLRRVTRREALQHPTWKMGDKISIDSATLMNKGLEVIEAKWLFDLDISQIEVVIHPQSIIHSLVEFKDGTVKAQLGIADMRIPIQYALTYPERWDNPLLRLDLKKVGKLTFTEPDLERFPCLSYAYEAARVGGTMTAVLNAANEVAVQEFLQEKIRFMEIPEIIKKVMEEHSVIANPTLEDILKVDEWARRKAVEKIGSEL